MSQLWFDHYSKTRDAIQPVLHAIFAATGSFLIGFKIIEWTGNLQELGQIHILAICGLAVSPEKIQALISQYPLQLCENQKYLSQEHHFIFTGSNDYPSNEISELQRALRPTKSAS